ncbi:MAG: hypothetical protein ACRERV_08840 [Methylococcales bacterium]
MNTGAGTPEFVRGQSGKQVFYFDARSSVQIAEVLSGFEKSR